MLRYLFFLCLLHNIVITPVFAEENRQVRVLVAADSWYRLARGHWKEDAADAVQQASARYQHCCRIRFTLVDVVQWDSDGVTAPNMLLHLKRSFPITNDYDVVVGFTAGSGMVVAGISEILGNYAVVLSTPFHSTSTILAHELGHIFGAEDTLMISALQLFSVNIFPQSFVNTIRHNRERLFRLPEVRDGH